jgi:hypothetical protein
VSVSVINGHHLSVWLHFTGSTFLRTLGCHVTFINLLRWKNQCTL